MSGNIKRVINVSTDEVYGESSLGAEKGMLYHLLVRSWLSVACFACHAILPVLNRHAVGFATLYALPSMLE